MPTTNTDFWDSLNHWRAHADTEPIPARSLDLERVLSAFSGYVRSDKLDAIRWARQDLSRQSRSAFVLKRAAELNKRPRCVDRDGKVTDPGHNGWPVVDNVFRSLSEAA